MKRQHLPPQPPAADESELYRDPKLKADQAQERLPMRAPWAGSWGSPPWITEMWMSCWEFSTACEAQRFFWRQGT